MCWSFLPHVRFFILLTVFELLPKTCNFTICSIFSNSGHVGWCTASPDTILKLDTLVMIQTKFGFHWSSTFRGEDFWKSLRRTTDDGRTTDDDDGRQVMRIAHMTLWVRWAKKYLLHHDLVGLCSVPRQVYQLLNRQISLTVSSLLTFPYHPISEDIKSWFLQYYKFKWIKIDI